MDLAHDRSGSGEPLVLIHGIGSRRQVWDPVIPALAAAHEVITLDLPGFGASPLPPPGTPPGTAALATLVDAFLARIAVDRPHVAGNSLGGLIALELAKRGRARSATALSPAGFASAAEHARARALLRLSVRTARAMAPWADGLVASPLRRRLALGVFVARPARVPPAAAAADIRALAGAPWFDETLSAIGSMEFTGGSARTFDESPVTVAWGQRDRLLPRRQARRAAAALPRARVVLLHGCGHVPMYDDPGQVAGVILRTTGASAMGQPGSGPVATGRLGSATHSLHDPG